MKNKLIYGAFLLITVLIFFSLSLNCYTSFQHPPVYIEMEDSTGQVYTEEVVSLDDCAACHEEESPYVESYSDNYDDAVYQQDYNWNYYFVTPWWFDDSYYYDEPRLKVENDRLEPTQRRAFDRRDTPPMPRNTMPSADRPSLAKPGSGNNDAPPPAPQPHRRHERRQTVTRDEAGSGKTTAPPPKRVSKEDAKKTGKSKKRKK